MYTVVLCLALSAFVHADEIALRVRTAGPQCKIFAILPRNEVSGRLLGQLISPGMKRYQVEFVLGNVKSLRVSGPGSVTYRFEYYVINISADASGIVNEISIQ